MSVDYRLQIWYLGNRLLWDPLHVWTWQISVHFVRLWNLCFLIGCWLPWRSPGQAEVKVRVTPKKNHNQKSTNLRHVTVTRHPHMYVAMR